MKLCVRVPALFPPTQPLFGERKPTKVEEAKKAIIETAQRNDGKTTTHQVAENLNLHTGLSGQLSERIAGPIRKAANKLKEEGVIEFVADGDGGNHKQRIYRLKRSD